MIYFIILVGLALIWAGTLVVQRYSGRGQQLLDNQYSWFVALWIPQFALLSIPLYNYTQPLSPSSAFYILSGHLAFALGSISVALLSRRNMQSSPDISEANTSRRQLRATLIIGLLAQAILSINNLVGSGISLSERLSPTAFQQIRMSNFEYNSFFLGSLSGPISILSSLCYVSLPIYFFSWGTGARWARQFSLETVLATATILLLTVDQLLLHAGRIGILFVIILAVGPALLAKSLLARLASQPRRRVSKIAIAIAIAALMIGSAFFQQFRGNRQDAITQLHGQGAELGTLVDAPARKNPFFANYMLQVSYLTTPSPTLGFYLDLPRADTPGPFFGRYNFHVIYRNVFRFFPDFDPDFWAKDRAELFLPLVRYGRGAGNIWATLLRDLMADFGRPGALVALFLLGGAGQAVGDAFRVKPTAAKAALLSALRTVFLFSALLSIFFLTWTVPALLILTAAVLGHGYVERAPLMARQGRARRAVRA